MNQLIGLWSSAIVTLATAAFALSMMATWGQAFAGLSYGICMVLSWSFLVLACAMARSAAKP